MLKALSGFYLDRCQDNTRMNLEIMFLIQALSNEPGQLSRTLSAGLYGLYVTHAMRRAF